MNPPCAPHSTIRCRPKTDRPAARLQCPRRGLECANWRRVRRKVECGSSRNREQNETRGRQLCLISFPVFCPVSELYSVSRKTSSVDEVSGIFLPGIEQLRLLHLIESLALFQGLSAPRRAFPSA